MLTIAPGLDYRAVSLHQTISGWQRGVVFLGYLFVMYNPASITVSPIG